MKIKILYVYACLAMILLASCANNKIAVTGPVGTKIYDAEYNLLGQIGNDKKLEIKMKSNKPLLLAVNPTTNEFALWYQL